jgi:phosphoserine phosphatase
MSIYAVNQNGTVKFTIFNAAETKLMPSNEALIAKLQAQGYTSIIITR